MPGGCTDAHRSHVAGGYVSRSGHVSGDVCVSITGVAEDAEILILRKGMAHLPYSTMK